MATRPKQNAPGRHGKTCQSSPSQQICVARPPTQVFQRSFQDGHCTALCRLPRQLLYQFLCNRISCGTRKEKNPRKTWFAKTKTKCYNPKMDGFEVRTPIFVCRRVDAQHGWCSFPIIGDNYRCNRTSGYDTNDISYWYKHDINYIMYDIDIVWYIYVYDTWYVVTWYMICMIWYREMLQI